MSLYQKKRLWYKCFSVNFVKFLRLLFLQNTSGRLLPAFPKTFQDARLNDQQKEFNAAMGSVELQLFGDPVNYLNSWTSKKIEHRSTFCWKNVCSLLYFEKIHTQFCLGLQLQTIFRKSPQIQTSIFCNIFYPLLT